MSQTSSQVRMLIRRPLDEVFAAFVRPEQITRFWLRRTSGPLAAGARLEWEFLVPGATETVQVTAFEPGRRIAFDWSDGVAVDIRFADHAGEGTRVEIAFRGLPDDAPDARVGAAEGFAIVLCDLKTLLESGRSHHLVRDKAVLIAAER